MDITLIWVFGKSEYFSASGWTAKPIDGLICPSGRICRPLRRDLREADSFGAGWQDRKGPEAGSTPSQLGLESIIDPASTF
jgi:hypothetical protein